ncbi:integumentary mucin A.1-like [Xenopus laevis]|uniref:Integumentary mucin A.1-like n=1 Tax=Xenopus laevis TaxID=8355 RepID=A0A8J1MBZ9_XENLA|nr:integumentary mucin A.1-like [Xenopus laevis]
MKHIILCTHFFLMVLGFGQAQDCAVTPAERVDCGYPSITEADCKAKSCCFDSSIINVKWCFYKASEGPLKKLECSGDPYKRKDCGFPGITEKQCKQNGCCFDSSIVGVKWCYTRTASTTTTTTPGKGYA